MWAKESKRTKLNVIKLNNLNRDRRRPARPLFITSQCGFDVDFLEYHTQLLFRGRTGWRTAAYANAMVYPHGMNANAWRQRLSDGIKYCMLLKELTPLGLCGNIVIGSIGTVNLNCYREYILDKIFPKDSPDSNVVVVDGHSKVALFWLLKRQLVAEWLTERLFQALTEMPLFTCSTQEAGQSRQGCQHFGSRADFRMAAQVCVLLEQYGCAEPRVHAAGIL